MKSGKKVLIIAATHGDERIGIQVVERLREAGLGGYFDILVGNPRALRGRTRFVDVDLNRSYPGRKNASAYERQLASKNLKLARKYDLIIDIHEAKSGINDFIIISREEGHNSFPLDLVNLGIVLFWPEPKGPMGQFLNNSIELEFGMKRRRRRSVVANATRIVRGFLERVHGFSVHPKLPVKKFYYVYGKILFEDIQGENTNFHDFEEVVFRSEKFYPLLVGQYVDIGIVCYKMRAVSGS